MKLMLRQQTRDLRNYADFIGFFNSQLFNNIK